MSTSPSPNTTNCTPALSSGRGPIRRCAAGTPGIPAEFRALLRANDTTFRHADWIALR